VRSSQLLLALAVAAGTLPAVTLAAPEAPFVADGEVDYNRGSASYDATRVRGPSVNMSVTKDGRWGGNLLTKDVMLEIKPDRISGAGVNLVVKRDASSFSVEGMISGIRVRVKATRNTLVARVGQRQVDSTRGEEGYWHLTGGATRTAVIQLKGTADKLPDVPMPQWIFALIGAL
jgi:hypothetical protein